MEKQKSKKTKGIQKTKVKKEPSFVKINMSKINSIIRNLEGAESIYLNHVLSTSSSIQQLIKKHKIPKKIFCEKLGIKPAKYKDFVIGAFNYSVEHLVKIAHLQHEIESKDAYKNTINGWISVPNEIEK